MNHSITWQCVKANDPLGRVIGAFGGGIKKGRFTHTDVLGPDGWLWGARSDKLQGIAAGCQRRPPNYAVWTERVQFTLAVTHDQYTRFWRFMIKKLGRPYNTPGLLETYVLGTRDWRTESIFGYWCSEWQAAAAEEAGIMGHLWEGAVQVTPIDWALLLTSHRALAKVMPIEAYVPYTAVPALPVVT